MGSVTTNSCVCLETKGPNVLYFWIFKVDCGQENGIVDSVLKKINCLGHSVYFDHQTITFCQCFFFKIQWKIKLFVFVFVFVLLDSSIGEVQTINSSYPSILWDQLN